MIINPGFLWEEATAANQYEGEFNLSGRKTSTMDSMTGGSVNQERFRLLTSMKM